MIVLLDGLGQSAQETCDERGFKRSRIVSPVSRLAPVREGIVLGLPVAVNDFQLAKYDASNLFFRKAVKRLEAQVASFSAQSPELTWMTGSAACWPSQAQPRVDSP
jgi:hypothetical protein